MTTHPVARTAAPRVVVVGGGFGGYFATRTLGRKLRHADAEITLISDTDGMLYQPLLPDVAVGALDPRSAAVPLNKTLPGARVLRGRVTAVRLDDRVIELGGGPGGREVPYDYLLLAPGAVTRMFDIPGLAEHAVGFKTAPEALYLRERVLGQLEAASTEHDAAARRAMLTFVVVGAGYAGTELTAQMARLSDNLLENFPGIRRGEVTWMLLDMAPAIMPELGRKLGASALKVLRARGVDVRLETSLSRVEADSVTLTDGTQVRCSTVVWAAGVTANPLVATLGLPLERGRLVVRPTLDVEGHPELFAIGDAAAVPDLTDRSKSGKLCPPTAQHAMRQGPAAARNIAAVISGTPMRAYRHRDLGLVVDLGGSAAVAKPLGVTLSGLVAKVVARGYHVFALPTTKRRLSVLAGWALAGSRPNDVTFGLVQRDHALAAKSEHHPNPGAD
jgi:NADH dehydrogenase